MQYLAFQYLSPLFHTAHIGRHILVTDLRLAAVHAGMKAFLRMARLRRSMKVRESSDNTLERVRLVGTRRDSLCSVQGSGGGCGPRYGTRD